MNMEIIADEDLIAKVGQGDKAAFAELIRRHQDKILSLSYRFAGSWDSAEDIRQETFLRVWKASRHYKPKAKFTTWLYSIAINQCIDSHRKSNRRIIPLENVAANLEAESDCDCIEKKEIVEIIQKAILELGKRQRMALILHRYHGLSHIEIAKATGWSKSAVESLLVRAYANLRVKLCKIKDFNK